MRAAICLPSWMTRVMACREYCDGCWPPSMKSSPSKTPIFLTRFPRMDSFTSHPFLPFLVTSEGARPDLEISTPCLSAAIGAPLSEPFFSPFASAHPGGLGRQSGPSAEALPTFRRAISSRRPSVYGEAIFLNRRRRKLTVGRTRLKQSK